MVNFARDGYFNKIFLFSTDSDFIPAAEYITKNCNNTSLIIVAPSDKDTWQKYNPKLDKLVNYSKYRFNVSKFDQLGVSVIRVRLSKFINCLFPDNILLPDGKILKNPWL